MVGVQEFQLESLVDVSFTSVVVQSGECRVMYFKYSIVRNQAILPVNANADDWAFELF